jgi:hypothetical protein
MTDLQFGDKTNFGWVIFASEGDNMVSHWEDYIFFNLRKDGKFSVKAYKLSENFRSPSRYIWIPIDSIIGITGSENLISAVNQMEASLGISVDWSEIIELMRPINAEIAQSLKLVFG